MSPKIDFKGTVLTTKNYTQFKTLFGNRFVNPGHVKKLVDSIRKINLMPWQPVLISEDGYVIDGQHRIEAAKQLKIDVHYVIVPKSSLETVQLLNSNMKAWTLRDFCMSYVKTGNEHYVKLVEFADEYGLPLTTAANLLGGGTIVSGGGSTQEVLRDGQFEVTTEENAKETVLRLSQIRPYADADSWRAREFIRSLVILYARGMDHETFIDQLKKTGKRIQRQATNRDYIFHILDIYNHGLKKNRIEIV